MAARRTASLVDLEFVHEAMLELDLSQEKLATILGVTQPSISRMFTRRSKLVRVAKRELERRLARQRLHRIVREGKALTIRPCTGHTLEDLTLFLDHMDRCPNCLLRAYRHITRRER